MVIAVLALIVLLALWWLLVQFRRARLAEVAVDSGDGEEAVLRGRALEGVIEADAAAQEGVARARIALTGRRRHPTRQGRAPPGAVRLPGDALDTLGSQALAHARTSTGLAALPTEARLRAVKHRAKRVT